MKNRRVFFLAIVLMLLLGCGGGGGTTPGYLFSPLAGVSAGTLDCTNTGDPVHQASLHKFDFVVELRRTQVGMIVVSSLVTYRPTGESREGVITKVDFDPDSGPNHVIYFWFEILNPPGRATHGIDKIHQNTQEFQDPNEPGGLTLENGTYEGPISADMIGSEYGTGPNFPQGSGGSVSGMYRLRMQKIKP